MNIRTLIRYSRCKQMEGNSWKEWKLVLETLQHETKWTNENSQWIRSDGNWDWAGLAPLIPSDNWNDLITRLGTRTHLRLSFSLYIADCAFYACIFNCNFQRLVIFNRSLWKFTLWRTLVIHCRFAIFCYIQCVSWAFYWSYGVRVIKS